MSDSATSMKKKGQVILDFLKKGVWYIVLGFIVIFTTAAFTGSAAVKSLNDAFDMRVNANIDTRIKNDLVPALEEINKKLDFLVTGSYEAILLALNKQLDKIRNDPADIKMTDMKYVVDNWDALPDKYKTADTRIKFDIVQKWYVAHQ